MNDLEFNTRLAALHARECELKQEDQRRLALFHQFFNEYREEEHPRDEFGRWTTDDGYSVSVSADLKTVTTGKPGKERTEPLRSQIGEVSKPMAEALKKQGVDPANYFSLTKNPKDYRDLGSSTHRKGAEPLISSALERRAEGVPEWTKKGNAEFAGFQAGNLIGETMLGEVPGQGWVAGARELGSHIARGYSQDKSNPEFHPTRAAAAARAREHALAVIDQAHALAEELARPTPGSMISRPQPMKGKLRWQQLKFRLQPGVLDCCWQSSG